MISTSIPIETPEGISFDYELAEKPQILAANKIDIPEAAEALAKIQSLADAEGLELYPVSAVTGQGVKQLVGAAKRRLDLMAGS